MPWSHDNRKDWGGIIFFGLSAQTRVTFFQQPKKVTKKGRRCWKNAKNQFGICMKKITRTAGIGAQTYFLRLNTAIRQAWNKLIFLTRFFRGGTIYCKWDACTFIIAEDDPGMVFLSRSLLKTSAHEQHYSLHRGLAVTKRGGHGAWMAKGLEFLIKGPWL